LSDVDLAASAFGQGQLLISPLTMAVIASTMANNGVLARPHVGLAVAAHGGTASDGAQVRVPSTDTQVLQPGTAQNMRAAMWAVSTYGTGGYGNGPDPNFGSKLATSGVFEGGKTGTAQASGQPGAWWISLAPDDQATGAPSGARYVIVVNKEGDPATPNQLNEGACQVYVADDIYRTLLGIH
jgi:peptidoglycan glycosyltransferase